MILSYRETDLLILIIFIYIMSGRPLRELFKAKYSFISNPKHFYALERIKLARNWW